MATTKPFFSGKDAVLRLFSNGPEVILNAKTWDCGPDVTKVADGVNGEDRDRLQSIVNSFSFTADCFMDDAKQIDAMNAWVANNDAQASPFDVAAAISIKVLDTSKKAYVAKEVTIDDWRVKQGGRSERVMFTLNFRARYFTALATL